MKWGRWLGNGSTRCAIFQFLLSKRDDVLRCLHFPDNAGELLVIGPDLFQPRCGDDSLAMNGRASQVSLNAPSERKNIDGGIVVTV